MPISARRLRLAAGGQTHTGSCERGGPGFPDARGWVGHTTKLALTFVTLGRKEFDMSASKLPLPLELTQPVLLAGDVDTLVRAGFKSTYDPKTQLCSDGS